MKTIHTETPTHRYCWFAAICGEVSKVAGNRNTVKLEIEIP